MTSGGQPKNRNNTIFYGSWQSYWLIINTHNSRLLKLHIDIYKYSELCVYYTLVYVLPWHKEEK